ncbi:MAG: regulatory protein RecX [Clostridia bacterium]
MNKLYNDIEEFDKLKTKVLKYIMYKKRTEREVFQKFSSSANENLLEDVIEHLKEIGYINDKNYIERAVNEFMAINTLSIKEIRNKLYTKGISSDIIDTYFSNNEDELEKYQLNCAKKIILKKQTQMEKEEIEQFLYRKGYSSECVKNAFDELETEE